MEKTVSGLTCNHLTDPLGIDSHPVFSWKYDGGNQTAYQIGVASSLANLSAGVYDCWDSGKVMSDRSHYVEYEGQSLESRTSYYWTATVYADGEMTAEAPGTFETGKRDEKWSARWIAAHHHRKHDDAVDAPYLRKAFTLKNTPVHARLYICSPGYFDAYINGQRVSDEELPTPFTKFDTRLLYCTYDVTDSLSSSGNAIGILPGNGWYNCFTKDVWNSREATWRHIPKVIAELHISFADGSSEVIATDGSWKSAESPIIFNGIRNGEHYDAQLIRQGWDRDGYDDSEWEAAKVVRPTGGCLEAMEMEPIRITGRITPTKVWQTPEGAWVFDTGQNMAGVAEITVEGKAGDEIVIKYSEKLTEDGLNINPGTVSGFVRSGEFQTDRYTLSGDGKETWHPRFVYHGFQYIEVSGCKSEPKVVALMIHTDVADAGSFSASEDTLNALQHATRLSTLTNLHGLPTDDPHREKNAWTGDVSVSAEQMLLNFHTTPLLRKWLADVRDAQKPDGALPCVVPSTGWGYNWGNGPDWSSALTHIPWQIYLYTGDIRVLTDNYEAITRHFGYMESMAVDGIVHYGIGDWCAPFEGRALAVNMSSFKAPTELTDTAYFYNAANTITRMASILGRDEDERYYRDAGQSIKTAFRKAFYDAEAIKVFGDCQTSTACMLYQGLHEPDEHQRLLDLLLRQIADNGGHQDTGILGNKYIYNVLGEAGRMDVAMGMILNETYPSFRNWMESGATTLWECWNGEGSQNHHMFSDVQASLYKYVSGIKPDEQEPGFRHIQMRPAVDCGLRSVESSHESPSGTIVSNWTRTDDGASLGIRIPGGCRATLELPDRFGEDYPAELASGSHHLTAKSS
jgi:alpha-L-rhamnosidase